MPDLEELEFAQLGFRKSKGIIFCVDFLANRSHYASDSDSRMSLIISSDFTPSPSPS